MVSFLTLAFSGGVFWEDRTADVETLGGLLRPQMLVGLFAAGLAYAIWVVLILGCHEMGHYLACRYYGVPATLPFFLPGPPPIGSFGAVIRIRGRIPHRRALFDIAAAGPIAGLAAALPPLMLGLASARPLEIESLAEGGTLFLFGEPILLLLLHQALVGESSVAIGMNALTGAGWVGMLITSLNLFPVGQLDGGHAAYAISRRAHRVLSRATLVGLLAVMLIQIVRLEFPTYLVWFAILLWMRDRHPRLLDESEPVGRGRALVAMLLVAIFVLTFIAVPVRLVELTP